MPADSAPLAAGLLLVLVLVIIVFHRRTGCCCRADAAAPPTRSPPKPVRVAHQPPPPTWWTPDADTRGDFLWVRPRPAVGQVSWDLPTQLGFWRWGELSRGLNVQRGGVRYNP